MNKFDRLIERNGTGSTKWDKRKEIFGRKDILPMWVADSDWPTAEPIIAALKKEVEHGALGYTFPGDDLNRTIVNWVQKRYNWKIKEEWIVHTSGVVPSMHMAAKAFTVPGDEIILQSPVYRPFFQVVKNNGAHVLNNQLIVDNDYYRMNFEQLQEIFADSNRVQLMLLCNPHNPVGRVWTVEEQKKLAAICREHDCLLVSDEIHADFIFGNNIHRPLASLSEEISRRTITMLAPSKTFNIAGLHTSVVIIPEEKLRKRFISVKEGLLKPSNSLGLTAMKTAYSQGEKWLEEQLDYIENNLDYAVEYINNDIPGIRTLKPEGTYLLWLNCKQLGLDDGELLAFMVNEARVGLNPGVWFGSGGEGYMRLNTACPHSLLKEGLERIKMAVENL